MKIVILERHSIPNPSGPSIELIGGMVFTPTGRRFYVKVDNSEVWSRRVPNGTRSHHDQNKAIMELQLYVKRAVAKLTKVVNDGGHSQDQS